MTDTNPVSAKKRAFLEALGINIPTGQEVYDAIMETVEPELVTDNLDALDAPYEGETADERKSRYERYSKAFIEYRQQFQKWVHRFQGAVKTFRKSLVNAAESTNRTEEEAALSALETQM